MSKSLETLLERARKIRMSPEAREQQRQSFAFGSAAIENGSITKETIRQAAADLADRRTQVVEMPDVSTVVKSD